MARKTVETPAVETPAVETPVDIRAALLGGFSPVSSPESVFQDTAKVKVFPMFKNYRTQMYDTVLYVSCNDTYIGIEFIGKYDRKIALNKSHIARFFGSYSPIADMPYLQSRNGRIYLSHIETTDTNGETIFQGIGTLNTGENVWVFGTAKKVEGFNESGEKTQSVTYGTPYVLNAEMWEKMGLPESEFPG